MIGTKTKTWTIEIPGWIPPSVNRLIGQHWGKATRHKRVAYAAIDAMAFRAGVPLAQGRRRVSVTVTVNGRGRLPDGDNMLKCLLDGLVKCGALRDDGPAWMQLGEVTVQRGETRGTVITLEDIPDGD